MSSPPIRGPLEEYLDWFAIALLVLITADIVTTMYAGWHVGSASEVNPLIRWALDQGLLTLTLLNRAATAIAVGGCYHLIRQIRRTAPPDDRSVDRGVEAWLGRLIAGGLFVFANNVSVSFHGRSLFLCG